MMCYRDMTFCDYYKQCKEGNTCHRAMTYKVKEGAIKAGLNIAAFTEIPECFENEEE